jgi:putative addiction module killer protein
LKVQKTDLFDKWLKKLKDKKASMAVHSKIRKIEEEEYLGKTYPIVGFRGISEIKIEMGAGYRIYFNLYIKDDEVWLLSGGDKSTQSKDIEAAQELLYEIQQRRGTKQ